MNHGLTGKQFTIVAFAVLGLHPACATPPFSTSDADGGAPPPASSLPCKEGTRRCSNDTLEACAGGQWQEVTRCQPPKRCDEQHGCVECDPTRSTFCAGNAVFACKPDGSRGEQLGTCELESCIEGRCQDPCAVAAARASYIGCDYWPVDLDNGIEVVGPAYGSKGTDCSDYAGSDAVATTLDVCSGPSGLLGLCDDGADCSAAGKYALCQTLKVCALDAQHSPFAVVVANPDDQRAAVVTLSDASGLQHTKTLAPGAVTPLFPQKLGFKDRSLDGTGLTSNAYHLTSTRPIVAYQFNPLDNVGVFSNDASLLLPAHAHGTTYYAVTQPSQGNRPYAHDLNGYVTVVASSPGATKITVTATAGIRAGPSVPAFGPGSRSFVLNRFDVLNLEAVAGGDLTGTAISGDKPFAVFGGHEAVAIGKGSSPHCFADHIEHQLLPAATWGTTYAIARSKRRRQEPDLLRIVAQRPNTLVQFDPPAAAPCNLDVGKFCDVFIDGDIEVRSSEPVLVGHFLLSAGECAWLDLKPPGDPALSVAVPTEQFRLSYSFLVPSQYGENYGAIVAPSSGTVRLDGTDITQQLAPFGGGGFKGGRVALAPGAHRLDCPKRCGIQVHGYGETVSYMFAGGLDLKPINID